MDAAKQKLEIELKDITKELESLGIHNPQANEDWIATPGTTVDAEPDVNVAADRVEEYDERRATLSVLERRFNDITHALKKIGDGTYGICEVGGEPIDPKRLDAEPSARTCIEHADVLENT